MNAREAAFLRWLSESDRNKVVGIRQDAEYCPLSVFARVYYELGHETQVFTGLHYIRMVDRHLGFPQETFSPLTPKEQQVTRLVDDMQWVSPVGEVAAGELLDALDMWGIYYFGEDAAWRTA